MNKTFVPAKSKSFAEIYQDSDLKYAFAVENDTEVRQVHDFILCRDFFNEALISSQIGCDAPSIYSFKYPAKEYPIAFDELRMILKGEDLEKFKKQLWLLNQFEDEAGYLPTVATPIPDTEFYYLTGDPRWISSTVMISLYTHLIRCVYQYDAALIEDFADFIRGCADELGNAASYQKIINEIDWVTLVKRAGDIFPRGTLPVPGMSSISNISHVHNNLGIVSWSKAIGQGSRIMGDYYEESRNRFNEYAKEA